MLMRSAIITGFLKYGTHGTERSGFTDHGLLPVNNERIFRFANGQCSIERLRLTSQAVKHSQHSPLYFVSLIRLKVKKVGSSTVILETQAAWNLPSTTVSTVAVAQLPCRLN